ncbi:MAG: (E)-4-hydroxy-3-methylbut-2-enyl-diphosphate synthase [Bacteroidia bacterium]
MNATTTKLISYREYCESYTKYKRRKTITVNIGDLKMGSEYPIRIQSMTTTDTMNTEASVAQIKRMVDAGCELVRLTAPSINEAQNLAEIKKELTKQGIKVPLVADIHFTPNAAELAARIVEKVRINPGNYADKKKFNIIEYSDAQYNEELERIREKFVPLVKICKEYGTAMRIGTNHGSLSDRIMSRYGDTPMGMVESAMEFLRIAEDEGYKNIVLSMKASNPQVMIQAYRLLVAVMNQNNMHYPLHLGVTEAGDGDDGRIKSALGIGALLEDGIGDTIRVSLTEDPEFEVPVAQKLAKRYDNRSQHEPLKPENADFALYNPYQYNRRQTKEIFNIGGNQVPRVIADFGSIQHLTETNLAEIGHIFNTETDKWSMTELGADYVYLAENECSFMLPMGLKAVYNAQTWQNCKDKINSFPLFTSTHFANSVPVSYSKTLNFVSLFAEELNHELVENITKIENIVLVLDIANNAAYTGLRNAFIWLLTNNINLPVIIKRTYKNYDLEHTMLYAGTDAGTLFTDGFGDGIWINAPLVEPKRINDIAFGILQASRTRISKTEYISCPSCGRTLFDLQETTALIRRHTDHLKGVKIAIMGCIVNGPGEMADADYGYVGSGVGKITLYRGKEIVKRGLSSENAVNELIELIKEDGVWVDK